MTKCQDCDLHFIDEGVRRERLYISDRECVECLKGRLQAEKDKRKDADKQVIYYKKDADYYSKMAKNLLRYVDLTTDFLANIEELAESSRVNQQEYWREHICPLPEDEP